MRMSEHLSTPPIVASGSVSAGTLGGRGEMAGFGLIRLPLGALGGSPAGDEPAHQPVASGFQRPAVLGANGVHVRSEDVEVIVGVCRLRCNKPSRVQAKLVRDPLRTNKLALKRLGFGSSR